MRLIGDSNERKKYLDEAFALIRGDERWGVRDALIIAEYLRTGWIHAYPTSLEEELPDV